MLLYEALDKSSRIYHDKIALSCENQKISYVELKGRVDTFASGLRIANIHPGMRVGLLLHNSIDFVVCLYGLAKNGNVISLLNTQMSLEGLENKLDTHKLDIIISENYFYNLIVNSKSFLAKKYKFILRKSHENKELSIEDVLKQGTSKHTNIDNATSLDDNIIIQSSSGTTGVSKSGYRTHRNLFIDTNNIITTFKYSFDDIIYCVAPFCHGFGLTMGLLSPIYCGAMIHIERWFMANRFFSIYEEVKPTIFLGIPEDYDSMTKYVGDSSFTFAYRKWFLCSGSPLSEEVGLQFNKKFDVWINQVYGMMEVSTISANLESDKDNFLSVGKPVSNVNVRIGNTSTSADHGESGEIFVKSETLSREYIESGKSVELQTTDGWFGTKDIGRKDQDGNIHIICRKELQAD
jgi:acyl-CoA synthetase (AMP-forming)/AMP-acid ligase II